MNIKPSPCKLASTEMSIEAALHKIEVTKSSYLLLVSEEEELSGILTKTDICKAIKYLKDDPKYFDRPVRQIMHKPVLSLPLELMHTAPEFMLKHGIEHVPVTELKSESKTEDVIGVITSDAVFEFMVKLRGLPPIFGGKSSEHKTRAVGVLSGDGAIYRLIHSVFKHSHYVTVDRYPFGGFDITKVAPEVDALVIDIDEIANRIWLPIIKTAVTEENPENVFVVYTPEAHKDAEEALHQLEVKGLLEVYAKPLNLTQLTVDLEKAWAKV